MIPTWDWRLQSKYVLYSSANGGSVERFSTQLPYYVTGNTLNNFQTPDMYPEDGWVLVHRDFGTPEEAQPFPFFTLYNKYRGIFRVMLYNALNREGTYFMGQLSFLEGKKYPEARAGLFTFVDHRAFRESLDTYDPEIRLTAFSKMTSYSSWAVFDFPFVGYDPDLKKKDPILVFKLTSIDKQSIKLKSAGNLQLYQAVENGEEARPGFAVMAKPFYEDGRKGYATYKTVDSFIQNELLSKAGEGRHKNDAWFKTAKSLAVGQAGGYAPIIAGLGAAIQSFVGGVTHASQYEPLNFHGQFQFETQGVIQTTHDLWFHGFFLNPGPREDGRAERPLQEVDWGIFNFTRSPRSQETKVPYNRNNWQGNDVTWRLLEPPPLAVNPQCGMDLTSVRVAFVKIERNGQDRTVSTFMTVQEAMTNGFKYDAYWETIRGCGMIWELKFRTKNPTKFADNEVLIIKKTGDWLDLM
jgi:hypothetical protein